MTTEHVRMLGGVGAAALVGVIMLVATHERDPAILSFMFVLLGVGAYELWRWQARGQ